jgi:hypothetical protein
VSAALGAPSDTTLEQLRQEFDAQHMVPLRGLLTGERLEWMLAEIDCADWEPHRSELKAELIMVENRASALLHFLMHAPAVFALVEALVGCPPVGRFRGRTYRMFPDVGHVDRWHNDLVSSRVAAISVNLSERPYEDGGVEMRDADTQQVISRAPRLALGDAVLLRLRRGLEHRVREVTGTNPKTAFAGFFYTGEPSVLTRPGLVADDAARHRTGGR